MLKVKLDGQTINADQLVAALEKTPLIDELYRFELVVLDGKGDRVYTINERGKVIDSGRNQGEHWLLAEYAHKSIDQSFPDAIAYDWRGHLVNVYSLKRWEIKALGYSDVCDRLCIGVEIDNGGFLSCEYGHEQSAQEFADWIKP